jgi:hypothetical protein
MAIIKVKTGGITADAITDALIADDVVGTEHLTANEVDTTALGADAVTGAQLADDAVNSEHYTDGSIDTAHIADSNVTTAKIAADAITAAKIADDAISDEHLDVTAITGQTAETSAADGDTIIIHDDSASALRKMTRSNFLSGVGGVNTPAFAVRKNSTQSISNTTHTKIAFNSEDFDTASAFDTSNSRFTVPSGQGGKYFINLSGVLDTAGNYEPISFQIRKNGSNIINAYGENQYYTSFYISIIASLSAGDYLEAYIYQSSDGAKNITNDPINFFGGFKLIE